jgi:hypothetical protein
MPPSRRPTPPADWFSKLSDTGKQVQNPVKQSSTHPPTCPFRLEPPGPASLCAFVCLRLVSLRSGCARSNPSQWHPPPPCEARPHPPGQRGSGVHGHDGSGEGAGGGAGGRHVHQLPPPRPRSRRPRLPHLPARRPLPTLQSAPRRAASLLPPLLPPRPCPVRQGALPFSSLIDASFPPSCLGEI